MAEAYQTMENIMKNQATAKKILLVDHQENLLASVLRGRHSPIVQVSSCIEAISKLAEQALSFSLILLDHQVRINEAEKLDSIKQHAQTHNISIFFCSPNYSDLLSYSTPMP